MTMQYIKESGRNAAKSFTWLNEPDTAMVSLDPLFAKDLLYVSSYDKRDASSPALDNHGYQRPPTQYRFKDIAKFFKTGKNRGRITPVIASVRLDKTADITAFRRRLMAGDLAGLHKMKEHLVSIIDGQHRIGGLGLAASEDVNFRPYIPVQLIFGLNYHEEATLFNTINMEQVTLPKAIVELNKADIIETGSDSYDQRIRRITLGLCRDSDSVWGPIDGLEQINMTGVKQGMCPDSCVGNHAITFEGLRRSTAWLFPPPLYKRLAAIDNGLPLELAKTYWRAVSETCEDAWNAKLVRPRANRMKELVAVGALSKLGHDIVASYLENGEMGRVLQLTEKLTSVNWARDENNPWMRALYGWAGMNTLYGVLYDWVYSDSYPEERAETSDLANRSPLN